MKDQTDRFIKDKKLYEEKYKERIDKLESDEIDLKVSDILSTFLYVKETSGRTG
jgi:hypothetical protein